MNAKKIGNILIIVSISIFSYTFWPFIMPAKPNVLGIASTEEFSIAIPSIDVQVPVFSDVDPWDKDVYQAILQKGIAHAAGTAKPGEKGSIYLFAHSSDYPWNVTRYNTAFFKLHTLDPEEIISINYQGKILQYKVRETITVKPDEVSHLLDQDKDQLILQTCTPLGTTWNRLLVFADPL